jgi:hypothetical protein
MPKLPCKCGYIHDLSPIPDKGWLTIRDSDYEQLISAEKSRSNLSSSNQLSVELIEADQMVNKLTGLLYECPECGNLMWQKPGQNEFFTYRRDTYET